MDKILGLLQWLCKLFRSFKPWLQPLYADANRPLATHGGSRRLLQREVKRWQIAPLEPKGKAFSAGHTELAACGGGVRDARPNSLGCGHLGQISLAGQGHVTSFQESASWGDGRARRVGDKDERVVEEQRQTWPNSGKRVLVLGSVRPGLWATWQSLACLFSAQRIVTLRAMRPWHNLASCFACAQWFLQPAGLHCTHEDTL